MSDTKKKRAPTFVTPAGTFKFPRLNEPDTKFNPKGDYSVKLILSADDAATLEARLKDLHKQAKAEGEKKLKEMPAAQKQKLKEKGKEKLVVKPLSSPVFGDDDKPTGEREFSFKMAAEVTSKKTGKTWTQKPAIFDAKGKPIAVSVWGGTVGKVSFEASPYFMPADIQCGVSLRLKAVQIIDLVTAGQRSAKGYGFDEEEGYEGEEATESTDSESTDADSDAGDSSDAEATDF